MTPPSEADVPSSAPAPAPRAYWCFISYRHADNKEPGRQWATWLHQAIETYEVPADLVGNKNDRGEIIPERIFPVFRDQVELPADSDLVRPIYSALDNSKYLIVICSPRSAKSKYVASEIRYFKKLGKQGRVLAAMIDGEPNASWDEEKQAGGFKPGQECFPPPLLHPVDGEGNQLPEHTEPIAADFRLDDGSEGWTTPEAYRQALKASGRPTGSLLTGEVNDYRKRCETMKLMIIAGVLGVPLGTLTKREAAYQLQLARKRARTLRLWLAAVGLLAVFAIAGGIFGVLGERNAEANYAKTQSIEYIKGIKDAAKDVESKKLEEAREELAVLPKKLRNWEWGYLMAQCPPPVFSFDHIDKAGAAYAGGDDVRQALVEASAKVDAVAADGATDDEEILSPRKLFKATFRHFGGRPGAELTVDLANPPPVAPRNDPTAPSQPKELIDETTREYGNINGVAFFPDESLILVAADFDDLDSASFADLAVDTSPPKAQVTTNKSTASDPAEPGSVYHLIAIPPDLGSSPDFQQGQRDSAAADKLVVKDDSGGHDFSRTIADIRRKDGHTLVLYNLIGKDKAAEIWDVTENKCLARIGEPARVPQGHAGMGASGSETGDIGGAFSDDETKIIICPVGFDPAQPIPAEDVENFSDEDDFEGQTAVFDVKTGKRLVTLVGHEPMFRSHGSDSSFGFSPLGTCAYHTLHADDSDEGSTCFSVVTGKEVKLPSDNYGSLEWSPDETYFFGDDEVYRFKDLQPVVNSGDAGPGADLQQIVTPHRYVVGITVYIDNPLLPLVDLNLLKPGKIPVCDFFEAWKQGGKNGTREKLTYAQRVLLDWQLKVDQLLP
jgi:hypothetical protein